MRFCSVVLATIEVYGWVMCVAATGENGDAKKVVGH